MGERTVDAPEEVHRPQVVRPPRRRGRTTLLIATAAALGLVGGACAGYLVQADRKPTKLPSLSQPTLRQAKGPAPEPLSAAQDRQVRLDGDLRKLLVRRPAGSREERFYGGGDKGWLSLARYAEFFERPDSEFRYLIAQEFRRAAVTSWQQDGMYVTVRLVQFRQDSVRGPVKATESSSSYAEEVPATDSWSLPGTGDGMAYTHRRPEGGMYNAEAYAWRANVAVEIFVYDNKPVPKKTIMDLAKKQMERLG